jgi:hypothetical protein
MYRIVSLVLFACVLSPSILQAQAKPHPIKNKVVRKASEEYNRKSKQLDAALEKELKRVRDLHAEQVKKLEVAYLITLRKALKDELQKGDLQSANAVNSLVVSIENQDPIPAPVRSKIVGTSWKLRFPDGKLDVKPMDFKPKGTGDRWGHVVDDTYVTVSQKAIYLWNVDFKKGVANVWRYHPDKKQWAAGTRIK